MLSTKANLGANPVIALSEAESENQHLLTDHALSHE
jgi:hypothetical protein